MLTTPFNIYKSVNIPVGVYNWTRHQLTYGSLQNRRWMVQLFERSGSYYDGRLNELRCVPAIERTADYLSASGHNGIFFVFRLLTGISQWCLALWRPTTRFGGSSLSFDDSSK